MIGAVVFVISFVLFLIISLVTTLPPGSWIVEQYIPDIMQTDYASYAMGIINGMIYGVIIWSVFSLVKMGRKKELVKPKLPAKALPTKKLGEPKILIELTEIKGIGPKRVRELKAAGVKNVSDLAKRSAKDLSEKTGISIKIISRWIVQANEITK